MKFKDFIKDFYRGQKMFGETIAIIINSLLLTIVYVIGVGLTALIAKLMKKHFLETRMDMNNVSYWHTLNSIKPSLKDYYRQF